MSELVDNFAHRLSYAITVRNIKPIELSRITGISKYNISYYMNGKSEAKQDGVKILAEALNVDPVWLMGYDVPMDRNYGKTKVEAIDVIDLQTTKVIQTIPYSYRADIAEDNPQNYFAVKASDNSMAPLLDIGDIAIIKKYKEFTNGKTYLLKIKGGAPIIRKVIQSDDGNIELQALNMWNYPTQTNLTMDNIEILGEVVRVENNSAFK